MTDGVRPDPMDPAPTPTQDTAVDEVAGPRDRRRLTATVADATVARQRAVLVGVYDGSDRPGAEASLAELERLTDTAGSDPVAAVLLRRRRPDAGLFIGRGQADEIARLVEDTDADVVVFDNDLTPAQERNLGARFEVDVVDREAVILDIFAQHARSKAGTLQVELALLRYHLPRLRGQGDRLSRQAGGIGTRGPGETKLESDRRRILRRITRLERELTDLRRIRSTQRKARRRRTVPVAVLVGYTNAGKSSLLNAITGAGVRAEDRLFSTVDSTTRSVDEGGFLLSDTVGFVRRLPHHLVEAFRSTLEEVALADLVVHVADAAAPDLVDQMTAVRSVLAEIGAGATDELVVLNKADLLDDVARGRLEALYPDAVLVSAETGENLDRLLDALTRRLLPDPVSLHLVVPYDRGDVVALLHREAEIEKEVHGPDGTELVVAVPRRLLPEVEAYQA